MASQQPQYESPIPIENSGQVAVIVVSVVSIFIPILFVALRLYARRLTGRKLDGSDYLILAALVFNTGLHINVVLMVLKGGVGFHMVDILRRFGPDAVTFFYKGIMSFCIVWNVAIPFSKLSVLQLYTGLFPFKSMIIPARVLGVFIVLWNTGNIIAQLNMCKPFARNFDQTIDGHCGSQRDFYLAIGVFNIIFEVIMLAMPTPFLYKLKLPTRKKVVLIFMFTIGFMVIAISIYRQVTLPDMEFSDMTHSGLMAILLSDLEPPVAISLACIPHLRPLLGGRLGGNDGSGYGFSGEKGVSSTTGRKRGSGVFRHSRTTRRWSCSRELGGLRLNRGDMLGLCEASLARMLLGWSGGGKSLLILPEDRGHVGTMGPFPRLAAGGLLFTAGFGGDMVCAR